MLVLLNGLQAGNRSGTGRYTYELARWLPRVADDLDFATLWPKGLNHPHFDTEYREAFLPQEVRSTLHRLYIDQIGIREIRNKIKANIVHYPASVGSLFNLHNTVVTVHDLSFLREARWFRRGHAAYYRYAVGRCVHVSRRIIADSHATAQDIEERLGISSERIDVVPLGVDQAFKPPSDDAIRQVRARYDLPERFFLYVGTLEPRKNLTRLIAAWSSSFGETKHDLVVAGREGWKAGPILQAIKQAPHGGHIHRPGYIAHEDLPAVFGAASAFVWPTLWEGFGLPPLEAMACGTPVLTSNVASLPEVVGDAALTVDPYDEEAIADGMVRLAKDRELRISLKKKGIAQASSFTWKRTARATADTYRATLNL